MEIRYTITTLTNNSKLISLHCKTPQSYEKLKAALGPIKFAPGYGGYIDSTLTYELVALPFYSKAETRQIFLDLCAQHLPQFTVNPKRED